MRNRWAYVLLTFLGLLVIFYLFRYHSSGSLTQKIPLSATQIIQVDLRKLEKDVLLDILSHPIKYIRKKKGKKVNIKRRWKSFGSGITIPKNVLFYTLEEGSTWISNKLEMNDRKGLSKLLAKEGFIESKKGDLSLLSLGDLSFVFGEIELIIVYSPSQHNLHLESLFKDTSYLAIEDVMLAELSRSGADVSYVNRSGASLEANFVNGALEINGTLGDEFDFFTISEHQINKDPLLVLAGQLDPKQNNVVFSKTIKDKFKETLHLSLDSMLAHADGNFSLQLESVNKINETIVTYSYDDDFNKVETTSTQEVTVPNMEINIGQNESSRLEAYLRDKSAIQTIDGADVFTPIPIYSFKVVQDTKNLHLQSGSLEKGSITKKAKWINSFKVKEYLNEPLEIPLSESMNDFLMMINQITSEIDPANKFHAKIEMLNPYRNFLGQLIRP